MTFNRSESSIGTGWSIGLVRNEALLRPMVLIGLVCGLVFHVYRMAVDLAER